MSYTESEQESSNAPYLPVYWPMYAYGQMHTQSFYYPPQLYAPYISYAPSPLPVSEAPLDEKWTPGRRRGFGFTRDKTRWVLVRDASIGLFAGGGDFRLRGLANPSFLCYMNSIIQVLLPFTAFSFEYLNKFRDQGLWHSLFYRLFQHFSGLPALEARATGRTRTLSVLDICADLGAALTRKVGAVGEQHDVGEALMLLLETLHGERSWNEGQDSVVYRIFRGVVVVHEQLRSGERRSTDEMFLTLTLAPTARRQSLVEILRGTFAETSRQIKTLPPVLCVELSRHHIENKETASQAIVTFPETLHIPTSCLASPQQAGAAVYQLYGVVVRSGLYSNSGHYWVAQRSADPSRGWHWINDEIITKVASFESLVADAANNWCLLLYAAPDAQLAV